MALDAFDMTYVPRDIADHLFEQAKQKRIARIDIDVIRGAVAGWAIDKYPTPEQREELENATVCRVVEKCA